MKRIWIVAALVVPSLFAGENATTATPQKTPAELQQMAGEAYARKDYATCGEIFGRLGRQTKNSGMLYNAACCYALSGKKDSAFVVLGELLDAGWARTAQLTSEPDLAALHDDSRWPDVIARSDKNFSKWVGLSNRELWAIMEADQAERESPPTDIKAAVARDHARQKQVKAIIAAGALKTSMDYFNAAIVLQHGDSSDDYRRAHELALRAVDLDPGNGEARWLAAASQDRYLRSIGKPQIYGTQFKQVDGVWVLEPVDESSVTDEERARWNVPPLAAARQRAAEMNKQK